VTRSGFTKRLHSLWRPALAGLIGAAVYLAVAEVVALVVARTASPVLAVGSFVIDIVPRWAKELAIELFGSMDKIVLLGSVGLAVIVGAVIAGIVQQLRPPLGAILFAAAGTAALLATVTRAGVDPLPAAIPSLLGTISGVVVLVLLVRRSIEAQSSTERGDRARAAIERRGFLRLGLISGAAAIIVGVGARVTNVATASFEAARQALTLPEPASRVPVPDGAEFDIPDLTPLFTPNEDFYRVDTALTVPAVNPDTWTLTVTGMVDAPIEISFDELVAMGLDEYAVTLTCVSNEVGGDLIGNARWLGVPVRDVLALASPQSGADMVLSRSVDGFTASTPLEALTDPGLDAILAVAMNGEPLPAEHGFPVRMVVPGLYGYVSATKWLAELKVTTFAEDEAYWTPRGYSAEAPIKLSSRIDTPRIDRSIEAGPTKIAGVAWAQPVGVARVEVQIDDDAWQDAVVSTPINGNTWVQWYLDWEATAGTHYVTVRATDVDGTVQTDERASIAPDGASGLQRTLLRVG